MMEDKKKYAKGHWMGIGMSIGIGLGMPLGMLMGILMDKIPVGLSIGVALGTAMGTAIGAALEKKHQDETRPLTPGEIKSKKIAVAIGVVLLLVAALLFTYTLLNR
jgi:hypothetical protein